MKKRAAVHKRKSAARRPLRSSSRRSTEHLLLLPFSFRRIILVTTCVALFVFIATVVNKNPGHQAVAGINITKGLFSQATITLPQVDEAVAYNIYYKKSNETVYKNAVRSISPTETQYTISYLTKGASYVYKISAVNAGGAEFWWSEVKDITNLQPM